jgi:uncharacterized protein DUF3854
LEIGTALTENDLATLGVGFITPDLASQAGITRVDSSTGAQLAGRNGRGDYAGLVIPYTQPWDPGKVVLYVLRRDHPDYETSNGKPKEKGKYLVAPGSIQRFYFPPGVSEEMLSDVSLPILLVEGEKKALAAWRLGWHGLGESAERPRFLPIGLRGVYGFRGKTGKETAPDGSTVEVRGAIADFARVNWRGRTVIICFDQNVKRNPQVKQAREELSLELQQRGARVSWFVWPADAPTSVNGIDDYIGVVGPDRTLELIESARPTKPTARQIAECPKHFEQVGEDHYRFSLPGIGIMFEVDRLRRERHELTGELCVRCDLPGARTYAGALITADFNFSSARGRTERAKSLAERANTAELDWLALLEEFCQRVLAAERIGRPAIDLRELERPTVEDALRIEGLSFPKRHPAILFGDGGSAKSYTGLYLAGRLVQQGFTVALFDWELAGEDHRDRLERLFGKAMPMVYYARCERALVYEVDRLRRVVRERDIDYAVYDSIAFACDGPPESAEIASRYFRAVRQVGVGSLHIAHITKADGGDQKPFGSAFWHNGARSTWYAQLSDSSPDGRTLEVGFFNRKSNLGRICPAAGFKIEFSNDRTLFSKTNPAENPDLATKMTVKQRMQNLLRSGSVDKERVVEQLEISRDTLKKTIQRYPRLFVVNGEKVGLIQRDAS